jgi:hypothetical protein
MLHPLEQVRDHHNPLADTPALVPCQGWHRPIPKNSTLA